MTIGLMTMTDKLEKLLIGEEEQEEEKQERNLFSRYYITQDALKKARLYASFAKDWDGANIECYGYLIGSSGKKNRIVEDVYFASYQTNNSAHTLIPAKAVIKAGKEIRAKGKRVLGWWHSHANMNPFHSGTDDENLQTVLNQVAPTNYINIYENMEFLKDDIKKTKNGGSSLIVCDRNNSSRRLEMVFSELGENPLAGLPIEKIIVRIPSIVSYAYSMVINAHGAEPYIEVATRTTCMSCKREEYEHVQIPMKVLDYNGMEFDEKKLEAEVKSKLITPKPRFRVSFKHGKPKFRKVNTGQIIYTPAVAQPIQYTPVTVDKPQAEPQGNLVQGDLIQVSSKELAEIKARTELEKAEKDGVKIPVKIIRATNIGVKKEKSFFQKIIEDYIG